MKKTALVLALLLSACTHDPADPTLPESESTAVAELGTDLGYSACYTATQACSTATQQCCWTNSYPSGACQSAQTACVRSGTRVDGPEDCPASEPYACVHGQMTPYGEYYTGRCQATPCNPDPAYDPYHVTLCHTSAQCSSGQACVRAGAKMTPDPDRPETWFSVNHSGLARYLWLCL